MKRLVLWILLIAGNKSYAEIDSLPWIKKDFSQYSLYYVAADSPIIHTIEKDLAIGTKHVTEFFKKGFSKKISVYIFPNRKAMTEQWRKDWNIPDFNSECWMVASGVALRLDVLSPLSWRQDACEHNGNDSTEIQQIITHELIHVFHGQQSPNPNFDGMDDFGWLTEGLANYASGQLTDGKLAQVREQIRLGNTPGQLVDFWKGRFRYQQSGSLIRFIDKKYGREKLKELLPLTNLTDMMKTLKTTEAELIADWKVFYK